MPLPILQDEPLQDPLHRLALRASGLAFVAAMAAITPLLWPGPSTARWLGGAAAAHSWAMALGFAPLFVLAFLLRIVPRATGRLRRPALVPWAVRVHLAATVAAAVDGGGLGLAPAAVLFLGAAVLWALSLGHTSFDVGRTDPWFLPWVRAGWLGLAGAVALALLSLLGHCTVFAAAHCALVAALVPITVGLSGRMLPALAGIGPLDRERMGRAGRLAVGLSVAWPFALAAGAASTAILAVLNAGLIAYAASGLHWLRATTSLADLPVTDRGPAAMVRWVSRGAWGLLALVWATLAASALGPIALRSGAMHLLGLGFLGAMMVAVAQRVLPAFVRASVRWPRAIALPSITLSIALVLRLVALHDARALVPSWLFAAATGAAVVLQVSAVVRPPTGAPVARGTLR